MFALPATPASVGAARRKVRELLDSWNVGDDTTDNALLVTSELVTNALTHTASERIVCRLRLSAGRLHVEVEDENRAGTLPAQRIPGPDEQCGRGLLLVGILSSDWGVRDAPHGSGRIVWAELPHEQADLADAGSSNGTGSSNGAGPGPGPGPAPDPVSSVEAVSSASATATSSSVSVETGEVVDAPAPLAAGAPAESAPAEPRPNVTSPATPAPAPVRPAPALPPAPPAAHAAQVAASGPWQPSAPHRTRPVPHSAEGIASHGPYGSAGTTGPHHPYSRS
ncbi:ATP-binding protein [Streptomyces geranii]|uniref:ATP-binding protein n=1 Tax=Streptomyces geranii TaxID=2058923 RepID=UPI000D047CE5|nr:ATP-binding protein [Streptomyces geranii]